MSAEAPSHAPDGPSAAPRAPDGPPAREPDEDDDGDLRPHFALRPDARFRLLLASRERVAAYEGDARELRVCTVAGLPPRLEKERPEAHRGDAPDDEADADEALEAPEEAACAALARAVEAAGSDTTLPVVLAADVGVARALRRRMRLPTLVDEELRGDFENAAADELHHDAREVVREARAAERLRLAAAWERACAAGRALAADLDAVGAAAVAGRVRRLWRARTARVPGRFDPRTGRCIAPARGAATKDALDGLATEVVRRGGEVVPVEAGEVPAGGSFCAELRAGRA